MFTVAGFAVAFNSVDFGADITSIRDGSGGWFQGSKTQWRCVKCGAHNMKILTNIRVHLRD